MTYAIYGHFSELIRKRGIRGAAEFAKENGFGAVEFLAGFSTEPIENTEQAKEYRAVLSEYGLDVACYSVGVNLYGSPEAEAKLLRHVELAAAVGSPYLHHTFILSAKPEEEGTPTFEEALADLLPRAKRIADHAKRFGVTCLYEEQGFYFNGLENFGRLLDSMKAVCDNVGVCGDFGNIVFADEGAAAYIRRFAGDIKHVHVKDYRPAMPGEEKPGWETVSWHYMVDCPLGEGICEAGECLQILKEAGYGGPLAFEIDVKFPDPYEDFMKKGMAFIEAHW